MNVVIFINPINYTLPAYDPSRKDVYYIGVDKGAYHALTAGYRLDVALGDFDSVDAAEMQFIEDKARSIEVSKVMKDETDSELAIVHALKLNPERILVYGGIGSRLDHTYANVLLLKRGPIEMRTDHQRMFALRPGTHTIDRSFAFISFFALEPVKNLHLEGFKYTLSGYDMDPDDPLGVSNEGTGTVRFDEGFLLVITNDDL